MLIKSISDICSFLPKSKIKAGEAIDNGQYVFFTSSDSKHSFINDYLYDDELIILGTGGLASCNYYKGKFAVSTDNFVLKTQNGVLPKYLYYFLRKDKLSILSSGFRGTGLKHISKEYVSNIKVPIYELARQQEIVSVLDDINVAIESENRRCISYDSLIKSRFNEMFCNTKANNNNINLIRGSALFKFSSGKFLDVNKRNSGSIPVYGGNGINWYTNEPLIEYPTLVLGRVGAYCGNVRLVTEKCWITDNALFIKEFKQNLNLTYLFYLFKEIDFKQFSDIVAQPKITQKPLENYLYPIPSLKKQNEFSLAVDCIDKLKFNCQQRIKFYQELLDKKMDEYFG